MFEKMKHGYGWGPLCVTLMMVACNTEDVPEWEPDGMDEAGETGVEPPVGCWEPGAEELEFPTLFQCVGEAEGELQYIACKNILGCTASVAGVCNYQATEEWTVASATAGPYTFPPTPPETEPNSQVCCEEATSSGATRDACAIDCARAACNKALEQLETELANHLAEPEFGCELDPCNGRVEKGLTTWINHLKANYDSCVTKALNNEPFYFPNPDVESGLGALACATLQIDCTLDAETAPYDLEQTCSTSENEPQAATALLLECELEGDAEISDAAGSDSTPIAGTVVLRRESPCTTDYCWFSIESLELDAASYSDNGYLGRDMHASLAYQGFGLFDDSTDEGAIAQRMFALDVTMEGDTPTTYLQNYAFTMANSDSAIFEVSSGQFQIVDAYFAWDDYELVITTDLATCSCLNCTL